MTSGQTKTLFFTASWCTPCKVVKRMLAHNPELADKIEIVDIDTHEGESLANSRRVKVLPTFIRPNGDRHIGGMNKRELAAWIAGGGT